MQQELTQPSIRFPWLFGARVDLAFFYGSVLFGILLISCHQMLAVGTSFWGIVLLNALGAGPFHQGATWFAFLDKRNRNEFCSTASKRLIFLFGPIAVFIATVLGTIYLLPVAVIVFFVWSLQHIVAQNIGILLLYHNYNDEEAVVERSLEVQTQWMAAITFGLIFVCRMLFSSARLELLSGVHPVQISPFVSGVVQLSHLVPLLAVIGLYTAFLIGRYFFEVFRQLQSGRYLNGSALLFWLYSIAALSPLAVVGNTFEEGNLIPSTAHWFQYIALNYVLAKVKYQNDRSSDLPVKQPMKLFVLLCFAAVVLMLGISLSGVTILTDPHQQLILVAVIMGLGNVHYYLDAFLWRFRDKERREAVLPYLLTARSSV